MRGRGGRGRRLPSPVTALLCFSLAVFLPMLVSGAGVGAGGRIGAFGDRR